MRKLFTVTFVLFFSFSLFGKKEGKSLKANFILGKADVKSMNAIAFGPEGILFIGDSESASIFAIDTKDDTKAEKDEITLTKVDEKIAVLLGTTPSEVMIQDMAVNPISKKVYFAVHTSNATPILLRLEDGKFEHVKLKSVKYSKAAINKPVASDAKDKRGRALRKWAISDLNYFNNKVLVSGLSNQEFGSTFRSIDFPFGNEQLQASLEVYHAAHGKYETHAPIKAFTVGEVSGKKHLIASYTCTPLVLFMMDKLKAGEHVKGRTIAELGNWNTPLDMIVMEKKGEKYLLMANSARALMKISFKDIANFKAGLTTRVEERSGTAGVDFIALPFVNVLQLDDLNGERFLMLQRKADGNLDLVTQSNRWL